ncbi:FAD-binding domain-containing protein [Mycena galericulata]|nr:FAD-binding domain-containing protein [Mycena galericulata]
MFPILKMLTLTLFCMLYFSTCLAATDLDAATFACTNLTASLGSTIVQESGAQFNATAEGTWSLFNSLDVPTCIVYPTSAAHVQTAMAAIYETGSKYAVIAGGHSAMVGWNSISNGVLIAFSQMQNVSYDVSSDIVTVQPGVHWADAIDYLQSYGVAVLGGRAGDIGTGLLLGGGISFLSPQYGWSADSLVEADVVLVTGQMVTANATNQYRDLFRALKGGANRFGIVTRYMLSPVHVGTAADLNWYGGVIIYPGSQSVSVSNASAAFIRENTDPKASLMVLMNTMNLTADDANIVYLFYEGASLPTSIFGTFLSIPSTSQTLSATSYANMANMINGSARGNGQQFGASAFVGNETTFLNGFNSLVNFTAHYESQLEASYMIISPVPRSQWAVTQARGGNAIGDPGVAYAAINFEPIYPAGVLAVPADVTAGFDLLLSQASQSPGLPLYVNECDASQSVFSTYPAYSILKTTYAKYDPTGYNAKNTLGPIGL